MSPVVHGAAGRSRRCARAGGRQIGTALLSRVLDSEAEDPWPAACSPATLGPYVVPDQRLGNPYHAGTLMHAVTRRSPGDHLYERGRTGPQPRPYPLTVFLRKQADFVVP